MQVTTIGLDIAKNVFQVHGIDAAEKVVVRKQLRRRQVLEFFKALPACLVGMEACATAHYWARELTKLGHRVRLMPAKDVKAYVKRNKNDAADAEAICEAARRPTVRFVQIKSTLGVAIRRRELITLTGQAAAVWPRRDTGSLFRSPLPARASTEDKKYRVLPILWSSPEPIAGRSFAAGRSQSTARQHRLGACIRS